MELTHVQYLKTTLHTPSSFDVTISLQGKNMEMERYLYSVFFGLTGKFSNYVTVYINYFDQYEFSNNLLSLIILKNDKLSFSYFIRNA